MASQIALIKATLKYSTQEELITGMRPLISRRGLFVHTRTTRPVGSEVHFEFTLADGSQVYSGEGVVRKEIPFIGGPSSQKSGMLIALRRINRPFKAVVDTILASQPEEHETHAPTERKVGKQFIVESRVGEPQGFDLFGDMDFDAGLDSLFSGIEKKKNDILQSGLYERPTVVSGLFRRPTGDEIVLDYHQNANSPEDTAVPFEQPPVQNAQAEFPDASQHSTGIYPTPPDSLLRDHTEQCLPTPNPTACETLPATPVSDMPSWAGAETLTDMRSVLNDEPHDDVVDGSDATLEMETSIEGNLFGDAANFDDTPMSNAANFTPAPEFSRQNQDFGQAPEFSRQNQDFTPDPEFSRQNQDFGQAPEFSRQNQDFGQAPGFAQEDDTLSPFAAHGCPDETPSKVFAALQAEIVPPDAPSYVEPIAPQTPVPQSDPGVAQEDEPLSPFAAHGSPDETPSKVFAALQAEIVPPEAPSDDESINDKPINDEPKICAPQAPAPQEDVSQNVPESAPSKSGLTLESLLGKQSSEIVSVPKAADIAKKDAISLDEVLNIPDIKPQDVIMTDLSAKKPTPRRREAANDLPNNDMPAPKKGGFFSNLFNKH